MRQADFAEALLDPARGCPAPVVVWDRSDAEARFAIHRNNVLSSLIDVVSETFPTVEQLVGTAFFRAMVSIFVRRSPPRSCVLALYGETFPAFLAQFAPVESLPYLSDVAKLEFARVVALHAKDADVMSREDAVSALGSSADLGAVRIECHPSTSILQSAHSVVSIWKAHQSLHAIDRFDLADAEACLVIRQAWEVAIVRIPAGTAVFVRHLLQGISIAEAAQWAVQAAGTEEAFELAPALALIIDQGVLTSIAAARDAFE